jgi:hypothetical protein
VVLAFVFNIHNRLGHLTEAWHFFLNNSDDLRLIINHQFFYERISLFQITFKEAGQISFSFLACHQYLSLVTIFIFRYVIRIISHNLSHFAHNGMK